jgi:hypothetical protein
LPGPEQQHAAWHRIGSFPVTYPLRN